MRLIWATNFEEETVSSEAGGGGKGLGGGANASQQTYRYFANFAVALCEGEVTRLGRVWADGGEITLSDYTHRFYPGSETQSPDSLIEAKEGADSAPAYRGLAYVVFERLPLEDFGNRIPQLNFEVFRAVDSFESDVRGVTMIPAAGEFAYHPAEVRVDGGAGTTYSENRHSTLGTSDWAVSVDQLEEVMANCGAVSLFVAWFGSDLRCGSCEIRPKVDTHDKGNGTTPISWEVAGLDRASADAVSLVGVRPAYGGTPSDQTVIAAIQDLAARGFETIFTPFLLMDIPAANGLTDPSTGTADQPAFPWRGRITCDPAPGEIGSPDQTGAAATQVTARSSAYSSTCPLVRGDEVPYAGHVAAFGSPWPGGVAFYRSPTSGGYTLKALAAAPAKLGETVTAFHSGPVSRWDDGNVLRVSMANGELASADPILVLGGANVAAVQNADGEWEVIQFANATLVSPGVYDLSRLLRGQSGTEAAMRSPVAAGARFVLLDGALRQVDMAQADVGLAFNWKYGPAPYDIGDASYQTATPAFNGIGLRPLSPVHVTGEQVVGGLQIAWIRRTRLGGDGWEQPDVPLGEDAELYEIDILNGDDVVRTLTAATPSATYTTAQQTADFGSPQPSYAVRVYQLSASYGRGQARETIVQ